MGSFSERKASSDEAVSQVSYQYESEQREADAPQEGASPTPPERGASRHRGRVYESVRFRHRFRHRFRFSRHATHDAERAGDGGEHGESNLDDFVPIDLF